MADKSNYLPNILIPDQHITLLVSQLVLASSKKMPLLL